MEIPLRIDATTIPALAFGGLLIVVALILGVFVWKTRRLLEPAVESDKVARLHADRQFRRRMQVSVMLFATGVLIPLGDQLDKLFLQKPLLFFVWIGGVLGLVFWMVLMALGDWLSTITYSEIAKAKLRFEQRELEEQVRQYRNRHETE
jgi:hypothetical protein